MPQKSSPASTTPDTTVRRRRYTTPEFAVMLGILPASIRTAVWRHGHYAGIKPLKLGADRSARLSWPAAEVDALFTRGAE